LADKLLKFEKSARPQHLVQLSYATRETTLEAVKILLSGCSIVTCVNVVGTNNDSQVCYFLTCFWCSSKFINWNFYYIIKNCLLFLGVILRFASALTNFGSKIHIQQHTKQITWVLV